jgi:hypothetical protein
VHEAQASAGALVAPPGQTPGLSGRRGDSVDCSTSTTESGLNWLDRVLAPDAIEKAWAKLKDILRRLPTLTRNTFDSAVALAMDNISTADISAWTSFAGYSVAST